MHELNLKSLPDLTYQGFACATRLRRQSIESLISEILDKAIARKNRFEAISNPPKSNSTEALNTDYKMRLDMLRAN